MMKYNKYFPYLIMLSGLIYLLFLSWGRWGDLVVDTFRDQWIYTNILEGNILYKDIFYAYGLLPPYVMAGLNWLFGIHLNCSVYTGIFLTTVSMIVLYRISRFFLDRPQSTALALNFLFVFAISNYCYYSIFNFILPYSVASTFFISSILLALFFLIQHIRQKKKVYACLWMFFLGVSFLCRVESGIPVWLAFVLTLFIYACLNKRKLILFYSIPPLIFPGLIYTSFFLFTDSFEGFRESVIHSTTSAVIDSHPFAKYVMGIDIPWDNALIAIRSFGIQLLLFFSLLMVCHLIAIIRSNKVFLSVFFLILFSVGAAYLTGLMYHFHQYRMIPILLILGLVTFLLKIGKKEEEKKNRNIGLIALFLVSLALISRIVLKVEANYGCFLAPLSLVCYYYFFIKVYPSWFSWIPRLGSATTRLYSRLTPYLFLCMTIPYIWVSHEHFNKRTFSVDSERGSLCLMDDELTSSFIEVVKYLENTPPESQVVVFPEGVGINYFSQRNTPLRGCTFLPVQIDIFGEDKISFQLLLSKVDYIVIITRNAMEYGSPFFGFHYGQRIYSWILKNYDLINVPKTVTRPPQMKLISVFKKR